MDRPGMVHSPVRTNGKADLNPQRASVLTLNSRPKKQMKLEEKVSVIDQRMILAQSQKESQTLKQMQDNSAGNNFMHKQVTADLKMEAHLLKLSKQMEATLIKNQHASQAALHINNDYASA